jgi:hypothetical protein
MQRGPRRCGRAMERPLRASSASTSRAISFCCSLRIKALFLSRPVQWGQQARASEATTDIAAGHFSCPSKDKRLKYPLWYLIWLKSERGSFLDGRVKRQRQGGPIPVASSWRMPISRTHASAHSRASVCGPRRSRQPASTSMADPPAQPRPS